MKSKTWTEFLVVMGIIVVTLAILLFAIPGCAMPSVSAGPGDDEIDARVASPDLLADKSKDETVVAPAAETTVAPAPEIVQGEGSKTEVETSTSVDTSTAVADTGQKGLFNANLAIIGGGSAFGGLATIALWLRWARKTGEARTKAQTERMKMLIEVIKAMVDKAKG